MLRKILCIFTAFILVSGFFVGAVPGAYAATSRELVISHNPQNPLRLVSEGTTLYVRGLSPEADYAYISIQIVNSKGAAIDKWTSRDAGNTVSCSFADAADGSYELWLYHSPTEYGTTYWSFFDTPVLLQDGVVYFNISAVYEQNESVCASKRTDKEARAYYLQPTYEHRGADVQSDDARIIAQAKAITQGLANDYQKLKAIHDWVAANIWYDYDSLYERTAYGDNTALGAYLNRFAVCQGYTTLTAALLRASGIPAKVVTGYALGISADGAWTAESISADSNHAWNEAYVDGRWVIMDVTWDSGNKYQYGEFSAAEPVGHTYFDIAMMSFSIDHRYDDYSEKHLPLAEAKPTRSKVFVDGGEVAFDAYNISDNNFFKLRDIAYILSGTSKQFEVTWEQNAGIIRLTGGRAYTPVGGEMVRKEGGTYYVLRTGADIVKDGAPLRMVSYNIAGNNYFKLRDLGAAFDFAVEWNAATNSIHIDTSKGYTPG